MSSISSKKWLISTALAALAMLLVMGGVVYCYDPYCYYRIPEDRLIVNNYRFLNAGLIRNAPYDTAIIGSSMIQNFNMDEFRAQMGINPVKLSVGALSMEGLELILSALETAGRAKNIILCVDIGSLNKERDELKTYPVYLYDDSALNDFRYLFGYETWMRLLPLNFALRALEMAGVPFRQFYGTRNIDEIGAWDRDAVYDGASVMRDYMLGMNQVSDVRVDDGTEARMIAQADKLIDYLSTYHDCERLTVFFPPYSALYWHDAMKKGYFGAFQAVKKYMTEKLSERGAAVYDFQSLPEITDLGNYRDITHYSGRINSLMTKLMSDGRMRVDKSSIDKSIEALISEVEAFRVGSSQQLHQANR